MSKYILNSLNNIKNKDIEAISIASSVEGLLEYKDSNVMILDSILSNTKNEMTDGKTFFKSNLAKVNVKDVDSFLDLTKEEKASFKKLIKENNINGFLTEFNEAFKNRVNSNDVDTYELVGGFTETINSIKKGIIDIEYMNTMVESINNIKEKDISSINPFNYLTQKIKDYLGEGDNATKENKKILVMAHKETFENGAADGMSPEDIVLKFYKKVIDSKGKSLLNPAYTTLSSDLVNDGFNIRESNMEEKFNKFKEINKLKEKISLVDGVFDESLENVKQAIELILLGNNDLVEYMGDKNNLSLISENTFLKDLDHKSIGLSDDESKKMGIVQNVSSFNSSIHELYGTDINVNVSELFYEKFNVSLSSSDSKSYTQDLLDKYSELKDKTKNKNNNILLFIALSSFDTKSGKYDSKMESKYIGLLTKPFSKYSTKEISLLNSIEDKWLKWAICHNREFKDPLITFTEVSPLSFNFGEFARVKKSLGRSLDKLEIEMVQASSLFKNLDFENVKDFFPKTEKERNLISNFVANDEFLIKLDSISGDIDRKDFYSTISMYNVFNAKPEMVANLAENGLDISAILKSDKDSIQRVLSNMSSYNEEQVMAVAKMLENPRVIPGNLNRLEDYLKYYATKMKDLSYKTYSKEKSTMPTEDRKINKDYEMKALTIKEFSSIINGDVCNHCMSYGGASWNMIDYMFKKPNNFFITQLERNGTGVANSATWRVDDTICFDSIEVVNNDQGVREPMIIAYHATALAMIANPDDKVRLNDVDRVTFGYSNHNNGLDFSKVGTKHTCSKYPLIKLPSNSYSDATSNQQIMFSVNLTDLQSRELNQDMIERLTRYSDHKDADHKVVKKFLVKYSEALDVMCKIEKKGLVQGLSNKKLLVKLFDEYKVVNETLGNDGFVEKQVEQEKEINGDK